jgi:5-methylcytosine-specific restriction endonuclease McrA
MSSKSSRVKRKKIIRRDGGYQILIGENGCKCLQWVIHCFYCNTLLTGVRNMTIDHGVPVSKGGKSDLDNLKIACYPCNYKKADKTL